MSIEFASTVRPPPVWYGRPAIVLFSISRWLSSVIGLATSNSRKSSRKTFALAASASGVQSALPSSRSQVARLSFRRCRNSGCSRLRDRERRLLIPQVAYIVDPRHGGIVEPHVRLLGASDPVDAEDRRSEEGSLLRDRDGLGDRAEQRALRGIEHAARIELDDHAEHVGVLQQIGKLLERGDVPGEVERIGTQPGEHADIALRRRRAGLVIHRERQLATVRQRAHAALDRLPRSIALQDLEPEAEADLVVPGLKLCGGADARDDHAPNGDRVIDGVREHRILAGRRENAGGQDGARRGSPGS